MPQSTKLITKSFESQCLAFPDRVEQLLAETETVEDAKGLLDQASAMQHYAERLKAGISIERPIAIGVLKIKAKLGELMPAKPPNDRGQGRGGKESSKPGLPDFSKPTISAYRKLATNADRLDEYYEAEAVSDDDSEAVTSTPPPVQTGLLNYNPMTACYREDT